MRRSVPNLARTAALIAGWVGMTIPPALVLWVSAVGAQAQTQSIVPLHPSYATVDTPVVGAGIYSLLPPGTVVESATPDPRRTAVFVAPPYTEWQPPASEWHSGRNAITWSLEIPSQRHYSIGAAGTSNVFALSSAAAALPWIEGVRLFKGRRHWRIDVSAVITLGQNVVPRLTSVRMAAQNCDASIGNYGNQSELLAHGGPHRTPAILLRSGAGVACLYAYADPQSGSVRVTLYSRKISGADPQMCLYQIEAQSCLGATTLPGSGMWVRTDEVLPVRGSFSVYLYANAQLAGTLTTSEYAGVVVSALIAFPPPVVLIGTASEQ